MQELCEGFHIQIAFSLTLAKQILTWKKLTSVYFWASAQKLMKIRWTRSYRTQNIKGSVICWYS
jgi:hypothetical protein